MVRGRQRISNIPSAVLPYPAVINYGKINSIFYRNDHNNYSKFYRKK